MICKQKKRRISPQTGISKDDGQVQTDNNKTSEKPSDEVSDQNKNVGTNNEQ